MNDLTDLTENGDYHLVHQYDPIEVARRTKRGKLEKLETWVFQNVSRTNYAEGNLNAVPQDYVPMRSAANIYMKIINKIWLV